MDGWTYPSAIISAAHMMQAGDSEASKSYFKPDFSSCACKRDIQSYGKHLLVTAQVGPVRGRW